MPTRDRRLKVPMAGLAVATAVALTAGCSEGTATRNAAAETKTTTPPAPTIAISPAQGSDKVRPDKPVVVTAEGGALDEVVVKAGGKQLDGEFDENRTRWESKERMRPSTGYTVAAKATGEGGPATATSDFTTLKPKSELAIADVTPTLKGEKVGVGAPIIVTFNIPVKNRAAVEKSLKVKAQKPVKGAWRWIDDTKVIYRTAKYWPAHQKVRFTADLVGLHAGDGSFGVKNHAATIRIGARQISTVDTRRKTMTVKRDGKTVQNMLISAGRATTREYTTTSGVHLTMDKRNPERMISPNREKGDPGYYDLMIDHAVRISNSGEYVHAKNNVADQGRRNVSHGCINARPDQARWFYNNSQRGDVVNITGTNRALEWNNGWGFWQMSFKEWKKGSALR
ncbi:Lipoprotein-anchoring transpeptidase ErfK/SrfK [Sinosporangium album]|uniref:Lipoprotein-anchoring transpeptidase ErfK/SrfK n=1 Tax=Sinosporangium album TaxID=504805 RepID=A0A1G8DGJ2_9ACTN|nr:Ig-like domain-containing protein [Sinosporangium album]SDH56751.1 Lipoprotein-anchoring transpeptidase ErfK/SrfK [Sinosporangium album]